MRQELDPEARVALVGPEGGAGVVAPGPRPFALTPLLDERQRLADATSRRIRFEVGVLVDALAGPVVAALNGRLRWGIGGVDYTMREVELARAEPYDLCAAAPAKTSWAFGFITACSFVEGGPAGGGRRVILPDPARVFGGLAARWSAASPDVALPAGVGAAIEERLDLIDLHLSTAYHPVGVDGPKVAGCVGFARYACAEESDEVRSAVTALARFAGYAGVGAGTDRGMGYVVIDPGREPLPEPISFRDRPEDPSW